MTNKKDKKSANVSVSKKGADRIVYQQTLKSSINCSGVALHSGQKISLTLNPAPADHGIVFRRTDIAGGGVDIPARWDHVVDTRMHTVIGNDEGVTVGTIEHLMAALSGAGIDNALVEVTGAEVPIMDGSAAPFMFLVECAGIRKLDAPRRALRVLKPVTIDDGNKVATLSPADGFAVTFEIDFDSPAVARQQISIDVFDGVFKQELSRARTFGFMHEVEALWAAGLAKGGSLQNAVVVSGDSILNEDGLRFADEFVRHKVLDAIGDLYLAGGPILAEFSGQCTGHDANNRLLRALFADADAWAWVDMTEADLAAAKSKPSAAKWQATAVAASVA